MAIRRVFGVALVFAITALCAAHAGDVEDGDAAFKQKDYATAVKLLMPFALKGDPVAQLDIGIMYFSGNGLPQNRDEAAKWFYASAQQGQFGAQTDIGIAYATGTGVKRDLVQAYMWFSVSAAQAAALGRNASTDYRDHVASELSAEELARAKVLVKKCQASNYRNCGESDGP